MGRVSKFCWGVVDDRWASSWPAIGPSQECWASEMLYEISAGSLFACTGTCTTFCSQPHHLHTHMYIANAHRFSNKTETACSLIQFKGFQNEKVHSIFSQTVRVIFVWPWKMVLVRVCHLFYYGAPFVKKMI